MIPFETKPPLVLYLIIESFTFSGLPMIVKLEAELLP